MGVIVAKKQTVYINQAAFAWFMQLLAHAVRNRPRVVLRREQAPQNTNNVHPRARLRPPVLQSITLIPKLTRLEPYQNLPSIKVLDRLFGP